ncbi:MAG: bifunctional phosphopantothenoylcysteine decarboxylase/phosphopantothenate--cysteine ligase CoaBC [Actinomycetota bacterium]|jgi:phosphopantothenoylcysteine decarboxylase/phosphopantothenate--cysteine ligase|nr:bifunctional phosphopantothenoylcysteine decarboxylase/phosphopantothenate--cysteine ligase CoaBC [Actinomycetota bacterium]
MVGFAQQLSGRHVLLGVSGGIAAYKAAALTRELVKDGATVQVILTPGATQFVGAATFAGLTGRPARTGIFDEAHAIHHVRLAREADIAVFAPATANLVAKFAAGLADDLVSSTFTCLTCPVIVAPAMHTEMWSHAATQDNIATLARRGVLVVGPDEGELAGGDVGPGRLVEPATIVAAMVAALRPRGPLAGQRVVVTAGGTREPIDPVRYIGNRSSGKMGYALAAECSRRGAHVELVSGPTCLPEPAGVSSHHVETALQMRDAVLKLAVDAGVVIKAAAVADFRPAVYHEQKIRKEHLELGSVELERNPDILAELGTDRRRRQSEGGSAGPAPLLVGFAAETDLEEERGRDKLHRKGLDLIVVNRVDMADAGFNVDTNRALLLGADGLRAQVALTTKAELAAVVCDHVEALLVRRQR